MSTASSKVVGCGTAKRSLGALLLRLGVLATEAFDATGGVHHLLLAREERMASGAHVERIGLDGAGLVRGAACAAD